MARNGKRADDLACRRDDFQRHDHIFDFAVFRRENACATVGEEAADGSA